MNKYLSFLFLLFIIACNQSSHTRDAVDANNRAITLAKINPDSSIYYFDKAIQADSNYLLSYQNKANFLISIGDYKKALETVHLFSTKIENSNITKMKGLLYDLTNDTSLANRNYLQTTVLIEEEIKRVNDFIKYQKLYEKGTIYLLLDKTQIGVDLIEKYSTKANIPNSRKDSILSVKNDRKALVEILILP